MKTTQRGFTLIELMIVVAIIGILAAVAFSAYQDYVVRSRVSEGLQLASALKVTISENITANGGVISDNSCTGANIPSATVNVASIECEDASGSLTIKMTPLAQDVEVKLFPSPTPGEEVGAVVWTCEVSEAEDNKYVPSECRV